LLYDDVYTVMTVVVVAPWNKMLVCSVQTPPHQLVGLKECC